MYLDVFERCSGTSLMTIVGSYVGARAPIAEEMMVYTALVNISQQTNTLRCRGSPLTPKQFITMGVTHDTWGNTTATEVTAK